MTKRQRGFAAPSPGTSSTSSTQPAATGDVTTGVPASSTSAPGNPATPTSGSRAAARRSGSTVKVSPEPTSFLEKYRFLLLIGLIVVGLGALGLVFMQSATAAPYTCTTLMTPGPVEPAPTPRPVASVAPVASVVPGASVAPTATPAPQPTQRLGFATQDLGRDHKSDSTNITYAYCPPASGPHFSSNMAPLPRRLYGPNDTLKPGNWVHNLEHGYVVLLYKGDPGQEVLSQLQAIVEEVPGTDFTVNSCGLPNKVVGLRFDAMTTPFAAVSWDRALLLDSFDPAQLRTFAEQWQESPVWPEQGVC